MSKSSRKLCSIPILLLAILGAAGFFGSFALLSSSALSSNDYKSIGDSLQNSSGVISIPSNISSIEMTFDKKVEAVYNSSVKPPTFIEYLPETEIKKNEHNGRSIRLDFNYLGESEPIYLLNGSKITYHIKVKSTNQVNGVACIDLFNDPGNYFLFLNYGYFRIVASECFFTSENTTSVPWSFDITEESQYYVGIYISKGVTVTSNVSIDRVYYDLSEIELTEPVCNDTNSCSLQRCSSCDESYIIIQTNNSTNISYTLYEYGTALTNSSKNSFVTVITLSIFLLTFGTLWIFICLIIHANQNQNSLAKTKTTKDRRFLLSNFTLSSANATATLPSESSAMTPPLSISSENGDQELPSSTSNAQLTHFNIKAPLHTQKEERADLSLYRPSTIRSSFSEVTTPRSLKEISSTQKSDKAKTVYASKSNESKPCEEFAKDVFGSLTQISVDSSGLMYHSSQYGVTLMIPEGAVQGSATVWFGAVLFSDKFKFGDYVPVTPIVWVHINRKLEKQAKLYVPHDVFISSKEDQDKIVSLTADNSDYTMTFYKQEGSNLEMDEDFRLFKIKSFNFCATCAAIHKECYKSFAKQYLIATTVKYEVKEVTIDFICLSRQQSWKKIIAQCEKKGFEIITYKPVTFSSSDSPVSLTFEPDNIPGWTRKCDIPNISASSLHQKFKRIDPQKDEFNFHDLPHLKIQFEETSEHCDSKEVTIKFNEINPPVVSTVLLKRDLLSLTATGDTELHSTANDPLLGDCLQIIATEGNLQEKWFDLGFRLDLTVNELYDIETICTNSIQCTRRVITEWNRKSKSTSMRPLSAALNKIGLAHIANRIDHLHQFSDRISPISVPITCPVCPHELFKSHFADINNSIAARLNKALDEFMGASLIPSQLYDDIITTNGPAGQKAAKITRELMRGISNCKNGEERLEVICKILLKLEDEKLKEVVTDIRSRIGTGANGASMNGGGGGDFALTFL